MGANARQGPCRTVKDGNGQRPTVAPGDPPDRPPTPERRPRPDPDDPLGVGEPHPSVPDPVCPDPVTARPIAT